MTDEQKTEMQDRMPRFRSLADVNSYIANPDPKFTIPRYIQRDGALVVNPEWIEAPYVETIIWGPMRKL